MDLEYKLKMDVHSVNVDKTYWYGVIKYLKYGNHKDVWIGQNGEYIQVIQNKNDR